MKDLSFTFQVTSAKLYFRTQLQRMNLISIIIYQFLYELIVLFNYSSLLYKKGSEIPITVQGNATHDLACWHMPSESKAGDRI